MKFNICSVLIVITLMLSIKEVSTLKCFTCGATSHANSCTDDYDQYLGDCEDLLGDYPLFANTSWGCATSTITFQGSKVTTYSCTPITSLLSCSDYPDTGSGRTYSCCETDWCNKPPGVSIPKGDGSPDYPGFPGFNGSGGAIGISKYGLMWISIMVAGLSRRG